jgi:D-alanine-D-alanine ligase
MHVLILFNAPTLPPDHPDWAQEAGVLESVEEVERAVAAAGHRTSRLGIREPHEMLDAVLQLPQPDAVYNFFEGFGGVGTGEAAVAGAMELAGWSYTGCPARALELARDKPRTKWLLAGAGLPTPLALLIHAGDRSFVQRAATLGDGPWIVKPSDQDASLGIGADSVVEDLDALTTQVERVVARFGSALVEPFIDGREFNVSVVETDRVRVLPLAEIEFEPCVAGGRRIVTYDAKWSLDSADCIGTPVRCPADVEPQLASKIERIALDAFKVIGCRDYARVDMRISREGEVFILEVNANPDLSPSAGLARALAAAGIGYDAFLMQLVENAARRRG